MSIGDFSRATHLSVRTLRRYHEAGLLEPDTVDAQTGYRYYDPGQIPTAQVIHRLRDLDVPLPEVRRILAADDLEVRAGLIAGHLRRLEAEGLLERHTATDPGLVGYSPTAAAQALVPALRALSDWTTHWRGGTGRESDTGPGR